MQKLAAAFVPAADASDRLQSPTCADADARLFQKFGGRRTIPSVRAGDGLGQGQYAVAPGGELLASAATADPREVAQMLKDALTRWEQLPRERRVLTNPPSREEATRGRKGSRALNLWRSVTVGAPAIAISAMTTPPAPRWVWP